MFYYTIFVLICAVATLLVLGFVMRPMLRPATPLAEPGTDIAFYRAQLRDLERDLARGTLEKTEAERARAEIARRLLAADRTNQGQQPAPDKQPSRRAAPVIGAVAVLASAAGLYALLGAQAMPDAPLGPRLEQARIVGNLEAQGRDAIRTGDFDTATESLRQVLRIKGESASSGDKMRLVILLIMSQNGEVTAEAERVARAIEKDEPGHIGAQAIIGLFQFQRNQPELAFQTWRPVVESGSQDPHARLAADSIELAAERAGIDYTRPQRSGPDAAEIAAVPPEQRPEMIQTMVETLAERLATQGGPSGDWARLIRSLVFTGQPERAATILDEAETIFADRAVDSWVIREAARSVGLR